MQEQNLVNSQQSKTWLVRALQTCRNPWDVKSFSHQVAAKHLSMSIPILPMHQNLCFSNGFAHLNDCFRLVNHSTFHKFKETLKVWAFLIVRNLGMHVTKTFVPAPIFDG
jgi:hypothetical protein